MTHDCVYCDQPGRFKIVNGHLPERGVIWVCAQHFDELDAEGMAWKEEDCVPATPSEQWEENECNDWDCDAPQIEAPTKRQ